MPWLTVAQNVRFALEGRSDREQIERKTSETLRMLGLERFRDAYPQHLSGGMAQRVALGRTLVFDPEIVLMDEPFGALDDKTRTEMQDFLVECWQKFGMTVLFVTHNIEEAVYVAERILVLSPKPTKVRAEVVVDLPRPRNFLDPKFIEIRRKVTDLIRWW